MATENSSGQKKFRGKEKGVKEKKQVEMEQNLHKYTVKSV